MFEVITSVIGLAMYFLPTIIAIVKKKDNVMAIGALNFFIGWTMIGWIVCLVWALMAGPERMYK
jgi:hypothetical protein